MTGGRRQRLAGAGGAVLLAFAGVAVGHSLEYLRVSGSAGLDHSLLGARHLYLLPLGALLTLLLARYGLGWWRVWSGLGHRLEHSRTLVRSSLRGATSGPAGLGGPRPAPSPQVSVALLWPPLALSQLCLYLLQENLESLLSRHGAPGIAVVTGPHWAASLIQCGVALLIAATVTLVGHRIRGRVRRLRRCERLVAHLRRPRGCAPAARSSTLAWNPSPLQRFGCQLWSRPPPA